MSDLKVIRKLANGTYGTVFLCQDVNKHQHVVKKISLIRENAIDKRLEAMVKQEAYILTNLSHPRIINLKEEYISNGIVHLVMEYASRGNLAQLIRRRQCVEGIDKYLKQTMVLQFFRDILHGLEYLHMKHVIHGDLKPANILIGSDGRLKIADFGISAIKTKERELDFNKLGTPSYMSPEMYKNTSISFASDVWALGIILYELCMLEHPFLPDVYYEDDPHKYINDFLTNILNCHLLPFSTHLTIGMQQLCYLMLVANPEKRASINAIICHPLVVVDYFINYFEY